MKGDEVRHIAFRPTGWNGRFCPPDILLTKSINGGATWSSPVTVNGDLGSAEQFHPMLSVESNGDKVTVTFYDRRDDLTNCAAHVYATQSVDNGTSWSPNVRLTTASSNFNGNPNGPGDYSSSTPFSSGVWPFFCDHRNPDFEVYTAKASSSQRPDIPIGGERASYRTGLLCAQPEFRL